MTVPFIRILISPNGKTSRGALEVIARPERIEAMAGRFLKGGGHYTIHLGPKNIVRLCCTDSNLDVLTGLDIPNGPELEAAVDDLVVQSQNYLRRETIEEVLAKKPKIPLIH